MCIWKVTAHCSKTAVSRRPILREKHYLEEVYFNASGSSDTTRGLCCWPHRAQCILTAWSSSLKQSLFLFIFRRPKFSFLAPPKIEQGYCDVCALITVLPFFSTKQKKYTCTLMSLIGDHHAFFSENNVDQFPEGVWFIGGDPRKKISLHNDKEKNQLRSPYQRPELRISCLKESENITFQINKSYIVYCGVTREHSIYSYWETARN
jgi:hypothetical protein